MDEFREKAHFKIGQKELLTALAAIIQDGKWNVRKANAEESFIEARLDETLAWQGGAFRLNYKLRAEWTPSEDGNGIDLDLSISELGNKHAKFECVKRHRAIITRLREATNQPAPPSED